MSENRIKHKQLDKDLMTHTYMPTLKQRLEMTLNILQMRSAFANLGGQLICNGNKDENKKQYFIQLNFPNKNAPKKVENFDDVD